MYVPLDARLPVDRLAYQLNDSGAEALLTAADTQVSWAGAVRMLTLRREASRQIAAPSPHSHGPQTWPALHGDHAAYVIYTSGSTGRPKGVVVTHAALSNYVQGVLERLSLPEAADSFAMVSTVSADLGHTVLFARRCAPAAHYISSARIACSTPTASPPTCASTRCRC